MSNDPTSIRDEATFELTEQSPDQAYCTPTTLEEALRRVQTLIPSDVDESSNSLFVAGYRQAMLAVAHQLGLAPQPTRSFTVMFAPDIPQESVDRIVSELQARSRQLCVAEGFLA